jgi:hypothetical protein
MLSNKQEQFAQNIISGMSYLDSYIDSYNPAVKDPKTISPRASNLAKSDKIQTRLASLREEINKPIVQDLAISKEMIVSEVLELGRNADRNSDRLKAYGLIASMLGFNIVKSEVTTQSTNINLSFNDLTMSELLKLANMPLVLESPGVIDGSVVDPDSDG